MAKTKEFSVQEEKGIDMTQKYMYVLAQKNEKRGRIFDEHGNPRGENEYPPRRNLLLRSSINWDGSEDPFNPTKKRSRGRHIIRYYDGCTTLFVDDQPKDKETIDQLVANTRETTFLHGYFAVYGYDVMLKTYADWCSYNAESPYRIPNVEGIFIGVDTEKERELEAEKLDQFELAMDYAKTATVKQMRMHARFLGVSFQDARTGSQLSDSAIRTEYRKIAKENPKRFIETYNDKTIQIQSWIEEAIQTGEISTSIIPNKAVWAKKGAEICDLSGIKSHEGVLNKLIEFSQSEEGAEFSDQLKALYN